MVVVGGGGWWWVVVVVVRGPWRPSEATEAISSAHILAQQRDSNPLTAPLGPRKLRLFGDEMYFVKIISLAKDPPQLFVCKEKLRRGG